MTPRAKLLLGGLAVVLVFVGWNRLKPVLFPPAAGLGAAANPGGTTPRRVRTVPRRGEEAPASDVAELHIVDLEVAGGEYRPGRNPFTFYTPPPPPPPPPQGPTPAEIEARRRAEEDARRRAAELASLRAEPPKPQPPPIDFSYIGSFGSRKRRIAVFLKDDDTLVNALVGDEIDGKFRLVEIGYESVAIEFVGFPDVPPAQLPVGEEGT